MEKNIWKFSNLLGVSSDSRTQKSLKVGSRTDICKGIHFWHLFPILKSILAPSSAFVATQSEISKIDQIWKCYIDHESEMQLKTNGVFGTYPNTRYCVTFFDFEKHQKSYLFCNFTFFSEKQDFWNHGVKYFSKSKTNARNGFLGEFRS